MAAIASFLIGGCLSIFMAMAELKTRHPVAGGLAAWIVLAIAFAADGVSWLQGMRQARRQAKEYGLTVRRYILRSSDPVVRAIVVEGSAALIGVRTGPSARGFPRRAVAPFSPARNVGGDRQGGPGDRKNLVASYNLHGTRRGRRRGQGSSLRQAECGAAHQRDG
jgi:hypothetical protein